MSEEQKKPQTEPTRLERLIAAQFRKGIVIPLTPQENTKLMRSSLEQRCDFISKLVVWTARGLEKHIKATDVAQPEQIRGASGSAGTVGDEKSE